MSVFLPDLRLYANRVAENWDSVQHSSGMRQEVFQGSGDFLNLSVGSDQSQSTILRSRQRLEPRNAARMVKRRYRDPFTRNCIEPRTLVATFRKVELQGHPLAAAEIDGILLARLGKDLKADLFW